MQKLWRKFPRTIQMQLTLCFLGIMLVMFLVMRALFSNYAGYARRTLADKTRQTAVQLEEKIRGEISAMKTLQLDWLLDLETIQAFSGSRTPDLADLYDVSFQIRRRLKLLWNGSNIEGLHFYVADSDYLLTLVNSTKEKEKSTQRTRELMASYSPDNARTLICYDGRLFLVNPYIQGKTAHRSRYRVALIFELSADKWFAQLPMDCVAWISDDEGNLFSSAPLPEQEAAEISRRVLAGGQDAILDGESYVATAFSLPGKNLRMFFLQRLDETSIRSLHWSFYAAFAICGAALCLLFAWISRRTIYRPLLRLTDAFSEVERGNTQCEVPETGAQELRQISASFNHMTRMLRYLIEHKYEERMLANEAELKLLQSQINPHFLYNSFFLMNSLLEMKEYAHLEHLTENLGRYFQYMFLNSDGLKTLEQEVGHAAAYADIQRMRFVNRIEIQLDDVPERWRSAQLPAMSIQPLIENAFQHGFGKTERGGRLRISFEEGAAGLTVRVANTGASIADEALDAQRYQLLRADGQQSKTALVNIHRRMRILYGDGYGLRLDNLGGEGFEASFVIPHREEDFHGASDTGRE